MKSDSAQIVFFIRVRILNNTNLEMAMLLKRPFDRSVCFESREGKSSPNNILLAFGKGRSPKLTGTTSEYPATHALLKSTAPVVCGP